MPKYRVAWYSLFLTAIVIALSGCSGNPWARTRWIDQQQLRLPHLEWDAGLSRLSDPESGHGGNITSLTVFRRAGDGAQQVLMAQNGSLHEVGLDGSNDHLLNMGADCLGGMVSSDGRWVYCITDFNGEGSALQVASLHANGTVTDLHEVQLPDSSLYLSSRWSHDGRYFAVVMDTVRNCDVTIFASPPSHATFTPVLQITSDIFYTQHQCNAGIYAWSSDSARLRLGSLDSANTPVVDEVTVGSLLAGSSGTTTLEIPSTDFRAVDAGIPIDVRGWIPPSRLFLYHTSEITRNSLYAVDPTTGKAQALVTVPYPTYQIKDFSWTVDGSHVLLVVNGNNCVDCGALYRSDVYIYTL